MSHYSFGNEVISTTFPNLRTAFLQLSPIDYSELANTRNLMGLLKMICF